MNNMIEISFNYYGKVEIIQCNIGDKMKDIINKFKMKAQIYDNNLFFIYKGDKINEELAVNQIIDEIGKNMKKMSILVDKENLDNDNDNKNKKLSKEIICPECKEDILMNINNYKINLYECKNGHKKENILFEEFENIQKIDLSEIICNECNSQNKAKSFNNKFFTCNTCGINLCPLCKSRHSNDHYIIDYDDKNYHCKKHKDAFILYCKDCKMNLCFLCRNEHNNHNIIDLGSILPNKEELLKSMKYLKEIIIKFKNDIEVIKNILNKIINNIEKYFSICNNVVNNYDNEKRNYHNYFNLNEIKRSNNNIINDINNIINEKKLNCKFNYINDIYCKIISINKTIILENGDKYIGEVVNNLKNGKGTLYFNQNNGCLKNKYEGDWKGDVKEGKGILYWNDGTRYDGDWKNGKREGKGILYGNNGERYEGDFKENKAEGKGIYLWADGKRYEGYFKENKAEGKGILYYKNGDIYEGDFKNNKREGKGIMYYNNGDKEMGDYLNDKEIGIHAFLSNKGKVKQKKY